MYFLFFTFQSHTISYDRGSVPSVDSETLNILLVDDDQYFVGIVASQLKEEFKYNTTIARDGTEARDLLAKNHHRFDIILTDYDMPGMNGLELLRWIRNHEINIPVVMLTAAGSEDIAVEAMKSGAYDYVRKEQIDLYHLDVVITGTRERFLFRVSRALEEERAHEIHLNAVATDKVRDVLNTLTPKLNNALANIAVALELQGEQITNSLPEPSHTELREFLEQLQRETFDLEASIRGLLGLYRMLYAHHAEEKEIEQLKQEIEQNVKRRRT
jgi:CheY-like chemotaxis protein